ncbi:membrane protein [Paenibacillus swuensis]|uniref:histidine kinase n=1 Tax=Paenibacillus swuensis TaxID=1178515 RepID=A0A172TNU7_9BACL|nr:membrane protein [Paenibacillus swuensis]
MRGFGQVRLSGGRRSLKAQLVSRTLLILAVLLGLIGLLQYFVMQNFMYRNEADKLEAQLMSVPKELVWNGDLFPQAPGIRLPRSPLMIMGDTSFAFFSPGGAFTDVLGESGLAAPRLTDAEYKQWLRQRAKPRTGNYQVLKNAEGVEQLVIFRSLRGLPGNPGGVLQMGVETGPLQAVLMRQLTTFGVLSALALCAGLLVYSRVLRRTLRPLFRMVKAVEGVDAGNLAERFPAHQGQEEIDRLAQSFNRMLQRLEASFEQEREAKEQMRRFIADASHELRTPLTSIHGFVEVLLRGAADRPEQLYSALNSMHGESRRIIKLVEDLLLLAKLDRAPAPALAPVELTRLLREMEPQLRVLAGERDVRFALSEGIRGEYDADQMKQVILNLFHNAVQHTDPAGGRIEVALRARDALEAELVVRDNGGGLPPESVPYVFDRFYRIDTSRTRASGGAGLGLSITKSIVEAHGGAVSADSAPGEGAVFRVRLPLT